MNRVAEVDPVVRLAGFAAVSVAATLLDGLGPLAVLLAAATLVAWTAGPGLGGAWRLLRPLLAVLVIVWIVQVFSHDLTRQGTGSSPLALDRLIPTWDGAVAGSVMVLRMVVLVVATWTVSASTTLEEVVEVLGRLRVPASAAAVITIAVAVLPAMERLRQQVGTAQLARGVKPPRGPLAQMRGLVGQMVPLFSAAVAFADGLAVGLANRGFGAHRRPATVRSRRLRWVEVVVVAGSVTVLALACWQRLGPGPG